jgi:putative phosphoesterase
VTTVIGIIADTHGVIRRPAVEALRGVHRILHAGDVGGPAVLAALQALAPVTAVRGNVDRDEWGRALPPTRLVEVEGRTIFLLHDLGDLDLDPAAAGLSVVVSGHSHRALIRREGDVLFVNPGSAGPRRFGLPLSVARLTIADGTLDPELIPLLG